MVTGAELARILRPPRGSFFLFGPRGTGKSTWLQSTFPSAHTINLLDEALYQAYLAEAGLFTAELRTLAPGSLVVLDEVQRLPHLLNEVKERKHPKLYWCDPGLVRAVKRQFSRPTAEERGALLEGWVAELLRSYRDYRGAFEDWFYWAPGESRDTEVDFLLRRGREFLAIEVKAGASIANAAVRGLRAIAGLKGLVRRVLVYGGERPLRLEDGIDVLPVPVFAEELASGTLFPA